MKLVRWILGTGCIILSFLLLLPAMPSEKISPRRLEILDRSVFISMTIYFAGIMLFRERYAIFRYCRFSKTVIYFLILGICFSFHSILRTILWVTGYSKIFGYPLYNIFVHSLVYSLMMCCILFITSNKREN